MVKVIRMKRETIDRYATLLEEMDDFPGKKGLTAMRNYTDVNYEAFVSLQEDEGDEWEHDVNWFERRLEALHYIIYNLRIGCTIEQAIDYTRDEVEEWIEQDARNNEKIRSGEWVSTKPMEVIDDYHRRWCIAWRTTFTALQRTIKRVEG